MNGPPQPEDEYEAPDNIGGTLLLVLASVSFLAAMALGGIGRLPPDTVLVVIATIFICGAALRMVEVGP